MRFAALRSAPRMRAALPWLLFGLGLVLATAPVWRLLVLGFNPSLDALLEIRCFSPGPQQGARPRE